MLTENVDGRTKKKKMRRSDEAWLQEKNWVRAVRCGGTDFEQEERPSLSVPSCSIRAGVRDCCSPATLTRSRLGRFARPLLRCLEYRCRPDYPPSAART